MTKAPEPKRIFIIPDTQTRPGVPLDHLDWIGQAIVDYKPDVVIHVGDHWDMASLNGHEQPGSAPMEGKRFADDIYVGNEAFKRISLPMENEIARLIRNKDKVWRPRKIFLTGNHEARADRVASNDPRLIGTVGSDQCDVRGWERYGFLERVWVEGICCSHFFQSSHSPRPIGGTIVNKLSRIGASFIHGHVQGLDMGTKVMATGKTLWGISAGSAYVHVEDYRGAQGQRHWRGVIVLNEVEDGEYDPMTLSLNYLSRKYAGLPLFDYMVKKYQGQDWRHLQ